MGYLRKLRYNQQSNPTPLNIWTPFPEILDSPLACMFISGIFACAISTKSLVLANIFRFSVRDFIYLRTIVCEQQKPWRYTAWVDQEGVTVGPDPLKNHNLLCVCLEILALAPMRSKWTHGSICFSWEVLTTLCETLWWLKGFQDLSWRNYLDPRMHSLSFSWSP